MASFGWHGRDRELEGHFYIDNGYLDDSSDESSAYDSDDNEQLRSTILEAWQVQRTLTWRWDPLDPVERLETQIVERQVSPIHDRFDALWVASLNGFCIVDEANVLGIPRVEADTPTTRIGQRIQRMLGLVPAQCQLSLKASTTCPPPPSEICGRFARFAKSFTYDAMDLPIFHGCCNLYQTTSQIPPAQYNGIAMSSSILAAYGAGFMNDAQLILFPLVHPTTPNDGGRIQVQSAIEVDTGLYTPGTALAMNDQHVWISGDCRVKAFDLASGQLYTTLFCGDVNARVTSMAIFHDTLVAACAGLLPTGTAAHAGLRVWSSLSCLPRQTAQPTLEDYEIGDIDGASAGPWLDLRPQYGGSEFVVDNPFAIEVSVGTAPTYVLPLDNRHVSQVVPFYERGVLAAFTESPVFGALDLRTEVLSQRFFGHLHPVQNMFTSSALAIATCDIHHAYLWDARTCTPTARFESTSRADGINTSVALSDDGTVLFLGGTNQSIVAFDVRYGRGLYELTTGNNDVHQMLWDDATSSLVASTNWTHCNRYCMPAGYRVVDGGTWPSSATHRPSDFGHKFDSGQSCILQYEFTTAPDAPAPQTSLHPVSDMW
ncbi:hypothetical protein DYB32_006117 [Aphanomyces invadans]|uniref:Uncharacterized protein n=1 Tax=Aphanomyces invadans TaxID=157072 RepID=A0A3R7A796_9STRA|nr:hypothetical protein DYB32_006117 [Aphanomyces invadans]